jgi:hypothetical protein
MAVPFDPASPQLLASEQRLAELTASSPQGCGGRSHHPLWRRRPPPALVPADYMHGRRFCSGDWLCARTGAAGESAPPVEEHAHRDNRQGE